MFQRARGARRGALLQAAREPLRLLEARDERLLRVRGERNESTRQNRLSSTSELAQVRVELANVDDAFAWHADTSDRCAVALQRLAHRLVDVVGD